jgi:phosphoribosyl-dephospho-CoA transferase
MPDTPPDRILIRPHDLLWLTDAAALTASAPLPDWASPAWIAATPAVMRRQRLDDSSLLPVGLRGRERSQRFAARLPRHAVARCVSPEALLQTAAAAHANPTNDIAALAALTALRPLLDDTGLQWGPTGGVGFALATGLPVLHAHSDLDLVLRAATPLTPAQVELLSPLLAYTACRIDLQIDTGAGGFSFAEWMAARGRVLLKTDDGPLLTGDPWQTERQTA